MKQHITDDERATWYESAFGNHYLDVYSRRNQEAAAHETAFAIERLGLAPGERVLDLCCGPGFHLKELRNAKLNAVGLDLSCDLVTRAREVGPAVCADMRAIPHAGPFAAVVTFFTTIGYFDDEDNAQSVIEISRVLERGGRFLIDYLNPAKVRATLVAESQREQDGLTLHEKRWIEDAPARVCKRVVVDSNDGAACREYAECVRLYSQEDLTSLLGRAGLAVDAVYGDFDGRPVSDDSPRMIFTGSKTGDTPPTLWKANSTFFRQIQGGHDRNFAYLIAEGPDGAAVDPVEPQRVLSLADALGITIRYVINTHGHFDHTSGNAEVLSATDAEIIDASRTGDTLDLGSGSIEIIATPGHTRDSLCALWRGRLMTGDTLFVGKVGGTGLGDDARQEYASLHDTVAKLPDDTEVWPGHDYGVDPSSTVGWEKAHNPFYVQPSFDAFVHLKETWAEYKRVHGIK
jgi:hydroxyacylglutathione hydrolase